MCMGQVLGLIGRREPLPGTCRARSPLPPGLHWRGPFELVWGSSPIEPGAGRIAEIAKKKPIICGKRPFVPQTVLSPRCVNSPFRLGGEEHGREEGVGADDAGAETASGSEGEERDAKGHAAKQGLAACQCGWAQNQRHPQFLAADLSFHSSERICVAERLAGRLPRRSPWARIGKLASRRAPVWRTARVLMRRHAESPPAICCRDTYSLLAGGQGRSHGGRNGALFVDVLVRAVRPRHDGDPGEPGPACLRPGGLAKLAVLDGSSALPQRSWVMEGRTPSPMELRCAEGCPSLARRPAVSDQFSPCSP